MTTAIDIATQQEIDRLFALQHANRVNLKLSTADQRKAKLQKLRDAILAHAEEIDEALFLDLRKERLGANHYEITSVIEEIDTALDGLAEWMKPQQVEPSPHFRATRSMSNMNPAACACCSAPGTSRFPWSSPPWCRSSPRATAASSSPMRCSPRSAR